MVWFWVWAEYLTRSDWHSGDSWRRCSTFPVTHRSPQAGQSTGLGAGIILGEVPTCLNSTRAPSCLQSLAVTSFAQTLLDLDFGDGKEVRITETNCLIWFTALNSIHFGEIKEKINCWIIWLPKQPSHSSYSNPRIGLNFPGNSISDVEKKIAVSKV